MITVYVDVLVSLNILLTYLFLVCTRVFLKTPTNKIGVAIASLLGGLSSLLLYLDELNTVSSLLIKASVGVVIVLVSFLPKNKKLFLKQFLAFMGITFLFGGGMLFLELTFHPKNILYLNGTVYFDMSLKYLVGSVLVIYGLFLLLDFLLTRISNSKEIYDVEITFRKTAVTIKGFVDTGNALQDGLTGRLVAVGELKALSPVFTYEEISFLKGNDIINIPESLKGKVHIIPCKTVGDDGLLWGFTPEKTLLNGKAIPEITVAVVNKKLSDGEYNILLNRNIMEWKI